MDRRPHVGQQAPPRRAVGVLHGLCQYDMGGIVQLRAELSPHKVAVANWLRQLRAKPMHIGQVAGILVGIIRLRQHTHPWKFVI
eukprot:1188397-Prorocentrum_minimum.AAC.2